jgi:hypothetical protein
MRQKKDERIDTSKTPKEKAELATAKNRWRAKMKSNYKGWTKKKASLVNKNHGNREMNVFA